MASLLSLFSPQTFLMRIDAPTLNSRFVEAAKRGDSDTFSAIITSRFAHITVKSLVSGYDWATFRDGDGKMVELLLTSNRASEIDSTSFKLGYIRADFFGQRKVVEKIKRSARFDEIPKSFVPLSMRNIDPKEPHQRCFPTLLNPAFEEGVNHLSAEKQREVLSWVALLNQAQTPTETQTRCAENIESFLKSHSL